MTTHQAYRLHAYGGRDSITLDDIPIPTAGRSELLVKVSTVAVNPFDWKIREGWVREQMPLQLPQVMGVEFCGTVAALGEGAAGFELGERVMSISERLGAFAEHIPVDQAHLARVPDTLDDHDAITLPMPGLTAWESVHAAGAIGAGTRVLIHGASGTSGSLAVQFAKAAGAYVIGTASSKNREHVMSLGADEFVDYQAERFEDRVGHVDLVLDYVLVGGDMGTTDRSWNVIRHGGAMVSVADPSVALKAPPGVRGIFVQTSTNAERLQAIAEQRASGAIRTKVARVFPRDRLLDALDLNQAGGVTGRLVVDFLKA